MVSNVLVFIMRRLIRKSWILISIREQQRKKLFSRLLTPNFREYVESHVLLLSSEEFETPELWVVRLKNKTRIFKGVPSNAHRPWYCKRDPENIIFYQIIVISASFDVLVSYRKRQSFAYPYLIVIFMVNVSILWHVRVNCLPFESETHTYVSIDNKNDFSLQNCLEKGDFQYSNP